MEDRRAQKNSQRATLRKQKGWKGFVHGYKKRREAFDKIWHKIEWGKPEDSGAKEVEVTDTKTIYKF